MVRKIMAFSNQGIVNRSQHILSHQKVRTRKPRRTTSDLYSVPSQKRSIGSNNIVSAGFTEKLSKVWVLQNDLFLEDEHLEVTGWRESWSPGWSGKGTIWNSREGLSCQLIPTLWTAWTDWKKCGTQGYETVCLWPQMHRALQHLCVCVCVWAPRTWDLSPTLPGEMSPVSSLLFRKCFTSSINWWQNFGQSRGNEKASTKWRCAKPEMYPEGQENLMTLNPRPKTKHITASTERYWKLKLWFSISCNPALWRKWW